MRISLLVLAFFPAFCLASNPTYDVTRGALQNNSALCGYGYNSNCSSGREGKHIIHNVIIELPSKYGAVAEGFKTGNIASSANKNSLEEAKKAAIANCERIKENGKCESHIWVKNGCLSISEGKSGKRYKAFTASSGKRNQAEPLALKKCTQSGAKDCRILMPEECSLPEIPR